MLKASLCAVRGTAFFARFAFVQAKENVVFVIGFIRHRGVGVGVGVGLSVGVGDARGHPAF